MSIICFGGTKGSGKSTASAYLQEKHKYKIKSYASKLKEIVSTLFSFDQECYDVNLKEKLIPELKVTPRQLMQVIGTELFRDALPRALPNLTLCKNGSIWINLMEFDEDRITIDDIRFRDEYENVVKNKGLCVRIYRGYANISLYKTIKSYFKHSSESSLQLDMQILNNGTKEELYQKIDIIVKEWEDIIESDDNIEEKRKEMCSRYQVIPERSFELESAIGSILCFSYVVYKLYSAI